MPSLKDTLISDLIAATKNKDAVVLSVLRMLKTAIMNKEISMRQGEAVSLSDEEVQTVISSEMKKRKDSIEAYKQGQRMDLAEKEEVEIKILEKYLPKQLGDEELENIITEVIKTIDAGGEKDFGRVMKEVMARVKGKADGNKVSEIIKKSLG